MPSTVAIDDQGSVVVGRAALAIMATKPERGVREIKRRFGDTAPILLGGAPWSADALTAAVLRGVLASEDHASMELILTHPANWGDFKLDLLRNVAHQAGHERVTLMPEPVAAARHYVASGRLRDGEAIAVYDFGGGTFDAAVLRLDGHGATVLASQGLERLGGIDIDQVVFSHVIEAIGAGADGLDREDPAVLAALAHLRMECTAAKEQLSADSEVTVDVGLPGLTTRIRITRTEFEDALRPRLAETVAAMDRALGSAGVVPGDLAGVVLVGGSSRIPLVSEMLASHFDRPLLVDADAKLALVEGAVMNVSTTPSLPAVGVGPVALADPPAQLPPPAGAVTRGPAASAPPPPPPAAPSPARAGLLPGRQPLRRSRPPPLACCTATRWWTPCPADIPTGRWRPAWTLSTSSATPPRPNRAPVTTARWRSPPRRRSRARVDGPAAGSPRPPRPSGWASPRPSHNRSTAPPSTMPNRSTISRSTTPNRSTISRSRTTISRSIISCRRTLRRTTSPSATIHSATISTSVRPIRTTRRPPRPGTPATRGSSTPASNSSSGSATSISARGHRPSRPMPCDTSSACWSSTGSRHPGRVPPMRSLSYAPSTSSTSTTSPRTARSMP